ncbi:DUF2520 domain-containing protein [Desulfonatronospira sp.]|uniref:Rossmann-like and DUF2520 domain-containing protein n=1 Tax=Desulfonatronospira sp. TaxID=1962951 RepID=UPI0025BAD8A1|nr:DUF2520 domain-containing protein [Desulfonatronospira sp.]
MKNTAIIGAGVVGTAMGYLLCNAGYTVTGIASRSLESAVKARDFIGQGEASTDLAGTARSAGIVFLTTSDDAVRQVCENIAHRDGFMPGSLVIHTSGALSVDVLMSAKNKGAVTVSMHPLQSLPSVQEAVKNIPGSYFCLESEDESALDRAREMVRVFQGKELNILLGGKPLYHAGAAAVSNFFVATIGFGLQLHEYAGINRQDSLKALLPLIQGTLNNIEKIGIPAALTGPIARGDVQTVEDHLVSISRENPDLLGLYCELSKYTVELALEKGTLKKDSALKILDLLQQHAPGYH